MSVAIMQPYFLPYIGYFQTMLAVDKYVVYDDVQFIKGGWINRNNLLINGQKRLFTISLAGASANKSINAISVGDDFVKFRRTVVMNYARAPFLEPVLEMLDEILNFDDRNLAQFIGNSLEVVRNYLGITTEILYSSALPGDAELKGEARVIAICKRLDAKTYVNSIGGMDLYARENFQANGIDLKFLRTEFIEYPQPAPVFVPGLSILDVLMSNPPARVSTMLKSYVFV
ncbi:hypothetical protein E3T51_14235 [Cryobacterium serini]|uniref:WbqC family protein n=1 Tax=Cryobacterium serini TaxID=1259201 RepID=A0A4R9BMZ5_9MICO|nr:hypothetical protein E3T51_14235 [Cryobacterium serini]